eukprot:CAMPEP_0194028898 /NCGR_PEP_ID=MMETSP0009_2-20130614/2773_1 /TAXON_ID=210454 /ORGANISM="Grammatophora oceanica, Strain CCMP 410" /LENGTH=276 /DNA_ID=CAMNT_0038668429 /DNA_START=170 /DNA_END=997 /DNA_ORIENTATION=-
MVSQTRTQAKLAFKHFITVIIEKEEDGPICLALQQAGYEEIHGLKTLTAADVGLLSYVDSSGATKDLNLYSKRHLNLAIEFFNSKGVNVADHTAFMALTNDNWLAFSLNHGNGSGSTTPTSGTTSTGTTTPSFKPADSFKKGIKHDQAAFPVLTDKRKQESWHRDMDIQANARGVEEILNDGYTPVTPDETTLFDEKQKHMYAVLSKVVKTDRNKQIITGNYKLKAVSDAQKTYMELSHERGANDCAYEWGAKGCCGDDDDPTDPTLALPSEMHIG